MTDLGAEPVATTAHPPLPIDRTPSVTIALFDGDRGNLQARLLEAAAQDYAGPLQTVVVASTQRDALAPKLAAAPWAICAPRAGIGADALEAALECAASDWIALLPGEAHPHPLWVDELVALAIGRPDVFAVAPSLRRGTGALLGAGARVREDGGWEGSPEEPAEPSAEIACALGDGLLVHAPSLRELLPLESGLDLRALGVEITLRAKARGQRVVYAPRSRVVVSARTQQKGEKRLTIDEQAELLLVARHQPQALARALGRMAIVSDRHDAAEDVLREAMHRAGIDSPQALPKLLLEGVAGWARRAFDAESQIVELRERLAAMEHEHHETLVTLHREMSWAHTLNQKVADMTSSGERDRAKSAADLEKARQDAEREKEAVVRALAEAERKLGVALREQELIAAERAGLIATETRVASLEARWRDAEQRRETAEREGAVAAERARLLEETRTLLEQARREAEEARRAEAERRAQTELELRTSQDRVRASAEEVDLLRRDAKAAAAERVELGARLAAAEDAFRGASGALAASQLEASRLAERLAETEQRREKAERALADQQVETQALRDSLAARATALTEELTAERRAREESSALAESTAERLVTLEGDLEVAVSARSVLERVASEQRVQLDQSRARAEGQDQRIRELSTALEGLRRDLASAESAYGGERTERLRLAEEVAALRVQWNDSVAREERVMAELVQLQADSEAAARAHRETLERWEREWTEHRSELQGQLASERHERSSLEQHRGHLETLLIETRGRAAELEAAHAQTREELERFRMEMTAYAQRLEAELNMVRAENGELHQSLHAEQVHAAKLHENLRGAWTTIDAQRRSLDETHARLSERQGDLARLRAQMLADADEMAERLVRYLEEIQKPRWMGRKLSRDERAWLVGPGARYVTSKIGPG